MADRLEDASPWPLWVWENGQLTLKDVSGGEYLVSRQKRKFAPVCPYHIYRAFANQGYIPDVVLLLAHDVASYPKEYKLTFDDPRWDHTTIIMDNSLVELKDAVDIMMIEKAVEAVSADIIVLPDVYTKGLESARRAEEAYHSWKWKFRGKQLMAALHAESPQDFFRGCEYLKKAKIEPDWISIPRISEGVHGYHRTDWIQFARLFFRNQPIHLLGFSDDIWEDIRAASLNDVVSIDSAVPLRLKPEELMGRNAGKRPVDWWETVQFDPNMIESCQKIDEYIARA